MAQRYLTWRLNVLQLIEASHARPDLADRFAGEVTPENLSAALDLGYLGTDGDEIVHISRRLLDASTTLVRKGIPLAAVLEAGQRVREHTDALAELFLTVVRTHAPDDADVSVEMLRPVAKAVVEAELSLALDRRLAGEKPDEDAGAGARGSAG